MTDIGMLVISNTIIYHAGDNVGVKERGNLENVPMSLPQGRELPDTFRIF
jgi:hypothetical protein